MPDPDPASMMIGSTIVSILFLMLMHLFQLCDQAFFAIGETRSRELEEDSNRRAGILLSYFEKEWQFSSRIRLNTLLCGILATALILSAYVTPLSAWISGLFGYVKVNAFTDVLAGFLLCVVSVWVLGFLGCLLPRRLAYLNPERIGLSLVPLFSFFYALFAPVYWLCALVTRPVLKMMGIDPNEDPDKVTEEDIIELIEDVEEIGALEESQKDMLNNIFEFDDITAGEIMTPRTDVEAIEVNAPLHEALTLAIDNGYSRLPVYEEDIDHIIGILYIKDLLPYVGQALPQGVTIRILLRETYFVPDTKKCDELFEEMNEKHLQMSIVVDEYGGVAGIVTIEDLLESIVGNMQDEFDHEEEEVTQLDEDSFEIDGNLGMDELSELLDKDFPEGDYDTVAGFLLDLLGHIPEENEEAVIEYENLVFTVQEMDDRRIEQVLVCRVTPPESADEE